MLQVFGITSAILTIISLVPYVIDVFKLKTKPERASWLIWSVLGFVAFFSQLAKGATDSLWLTGAQTFVVLVVFLLSLKYGVGGLMKRDVAALIVAGVGIVLWFLTKEASIALFIVIAVDFSGSILTMIKSYEDPGSETLITWVLSGTSGFLGALAVGEWNLVLLSYPVYIWLINYLIAVSMLLGARKSKLQQ